MWATGVYILFPACTFYWLIEIETFNILGIFFFISENQREVIPHPLLIHSDHKISGQNAFCLCGRRIDKTVRTTVITLL